MSLILSGTDGLSDVDGTAAAPAIRGTDANTGIFFPAADTIAFAEGGAEAMRIDASGNVGIGTSSPGAKLESLVTSIGAPSLRLRYNAASYYFDASMDANGNTVFMVPAANGVTSGNLLLGAGGAERARIDSSGNLLVGTTSTLGAKFALYGTGSGTNSSIQITNPGIGTGCIGVLGTGSNFKLYNCYTSGTLGTGAGIDIDTSGNLLVGTTATQNGNRLYVQSSNFVVGINGTNTTGEAVRFYSNGTTCGTISYTASTVAYNTSSDYRLKEAIAPMTGALAKVALLKPCTYKWKIDGSDGQGFIAHELDEVVSGCVTGEKDAVKEEQYEVTPAVKDADGNTITEAVMGTRMAPQYQGIDTSFLVATLTAAIQEQQALITALTTRITALEAA